MIAWVMSGAWSASRPGSGSSSPSSGRLLAVSLRLEGRVGCLFPLTTEREWDDALLSNRRRRSGGHDVLVEAEQVLGVIAAFDCP
jgi:hypothetical protein